MPLTWMHQNSLHERSDFRTSNKRRRVFRSLALEVADDALDTIPDAAVRALISCFLALRTIDSMPLAFATLFLPAQILVCYIYRLNPLAVLFGKGRAPYSSLRWILVLGNQHSLGADDRLQAYSCTLTTPRGCLAAQDAQCYEVHSTAAPSSSGSTSCTCVHCHNGMARSARALCGYPHDCI